MRKRSEGASFIIAPIMRGEPAYWVSIPRLLRIGGHSLKYLDRLRIHRISRQNP